MEREVMNKKEAAEFLRISVSSLERLIREKKIPYSKTNGRVLFLKKDLLKFVESKKVK